MRKIKIGTDCSGIEAPIEALKQMKIPFDHKWSCDNDIYVKKSIEANYKPERFYDDITERNHKDLPDIDFYICGFPCQPFSRAGNKLGMKDKRSSIMLECLETIKIKKPKLFLLENVKGFKTIDEGKPFNFLLKQLNKLDYYNIYTEILNTKDYGIPQNRERLFIFGIAKNIKQKEYKKPKPVKMKDLSFFMDKSIIHESVINKSLEKNLKAIEYKNDYIITPFTFKSMGYKICPTLTTNCSSFYHTTYKRYLTVGECLSLQGFSKKFKQVVSNSQMYKQIGNSMSVNVLKALFTEIFKIEDKQENILAS